MSIYSILLLFFLLSLTTWLGFKSLKMKETAREEHWGWFIAYTLFYWLYADKFIDIASNIDGLKDLNRWVLFLIALIALIIYARLVKMILRKVT